MHTVALCVKGVVNGRMLWQSFMDEVNDVTAYSIHQQKAAQMLVALQLETGVRNDRLVKLKQEALTEWYSRLAAMVTYTTHADLIRKVINEPNVSGCALHMHKPERKEKMAEFVVVLKKTRRFARALEAD